jgi:hypothetical protein
MDLDWTGTGYGVATQCSAIPRNSCNFSSVDKDDYPWPFQCMTSTLLGNITGYYGSIEMETRGYQWHQYMRETPPFTGTEIGDPPQLIWNNSPNDTDLANMTRETP